MTETTDHLRAELAAVAAELDTAMNWLYTDTDAVAGLIESAEAALKRAQQLVAELSTEVTA